MGEREQARAIAQAMHDGSMGLAEGVRRLFAMRAGLAATDPLRPLLEPLAALGSHYDLALAGYESLEALTVQMRQGAEQLLRALG